jgi:uncharacterized RDD family membrane protein YckC
VAKLILNPTTPHRQEISLPRLPLSIGRDPSNDLVLADAMVSRRHATIEMRGGQYLLRDCNSSNGCLVNGNRVIERELRDGDLVYIGTARLLFREEAVPLDAEGKVVRHPSSLRLRCAACGSDCRFGEVFCRQCGARLPSAPPKLTCDSCGTQVAPPARFCSACGGRLTEAARDLGGPAPTPAVPEPRPTEEPVPAAPAARETAPGDRTDPPPPLEIAVGDGAPRPVPAEQPRPARAPQPWRQPSAWPQAPAAARAVMPAGFAPRLVAGALDALLLGLAGAAALLPLARYWWSRDLASVSFEAVLLSLLAVGGLVLGGALYYVLAWGLQGATAGQWLLGLVVEDQKGGRVGLGQAALRVVGYALSAVLLGFGFLMIAFDGYGLHDRIAGTRVVSRERR